MKLIHVVTTSPSLEFLTRQVGFMQTQGADVHVASSPGPGLTAFGQREDVTTHAIRMRRAISPLGDLASILQTFALFRRLRPDIVHAHTPKASLISMIAASLASVPCRIFHIHGLPHSTATGIAHVMLRWATKISSLLATRVLCVSPSVAAMAVTEGLCPAAKINVLAHGSINGVDAVDVFSPLKFSREQSRTMFGLCADDLVIGFAGRLVRDKGVSELHESWACIREEFPNCYLVIAGEADERDALPESTLRSLESDPRVVMLGHCRDMPSFYSSIDVLVLPTYREGLPGVILESAAMQVPAIATRAAGSVDSVADGETGRLVDVADHEQITAALRDYLSSRSLREQHGRAARDRVLRNFRPEAIWDATLHEYRMELAKVSACARGQILSAAVKRGLDISLSLVALIFVSPLLLATAILVQFRLGSPVLFRQKRPGLNERPFDVVKFRTMRIAFDDAGTPLPDHERITILGRLLRQTSLDELPQLWCVLKGEMSLVGPRPLLFSYLERYAPEHRRRHAVKPGITGWAQINGRNSVSWEQKFELDVWYVDHASLALDLKILFRTFLTVIKGDGISQIDHVTMPEFLGNTASGVSLSSESTPS